MDRQLEKSVKQWSGILLAIVSYYIIHEGTHFLLAMILGVFEEIRFAGIWGIQIVTTEGSLSGMNLALFSGLSSIVTILIGYILALHPSIYKIKNKNILIGIYYITLCFLLLDPLYMSLLSKFIGGGGDLNGITTGLGTSDIPFRILFGIILIINILLFKNKVCSRYNRIFKENKNINK